MTFFKSNKTRSFKLDVAPIGFYFDIFSTSLFEIPILPIPLRIDKVFKGEPSLLISPNLKKLKRIFKKFGYYIDYDLFYKIGIKNLLKYSHFKQLDITGKKYGDIPIIKKWWASSNCISTTNPDLIESFTFLTSQFIKIYSEIDKNNLSLIFNKEEYLNKLNEYCESIITYFRNKIEMNLFITQNEEGQINPEQLYIERRKKFFPLETQIQIHDLNTNETHDMKFVPYLIYEDLLDSFSYNKKLLMNADNPINLKVYEDNKIINKTSTIDDFRTILSKIELKKLNFEEILEIYRV